MDEVVDLLGSEPVKRWWKYALVRAFKLETVHLGQVFVLGQWLMRKKEVSPRQHCSANDGMIATLANAMCLIFSYPLDSGSSEIENMNNS
jgi:hypothetical protein